MLLAVLVLASAAALCLPAEFVSAQASGVNVQSVSPSEGQAGSQLTITIQGSIPTANGPFNVSFGTGGNMVNVAQGTAAGNSVKANFTVYNVWPGYYNITLTDTTAAQSKTVEYHATSEGLAAIPLATLFILGVAFAISFANMGLNRALITRMIGWHEYRSMQKELAEYNSQRMAALRAKDDRALEKLKKKDSQMQAMQTKMMKPNLLLLPITFIYIVIWPILQGFSPFFVAYLPGFGAVPFVYWYFACSFFFGTLAAKVIGVTPIQ